MIKMIRMIVKIVLKNNYKWVISILLYYYYSFHVYLISVCSFADLLALRKGEGVPAERIGFIYNLCRL